MTPLDLHWLLPRRLALGSHPGRAGPLDDVLPRYRAAGVGAIVTASEHPLPPSALARAGLAALHLPVDDEHAPEPEQLDAFVAFVDAQAAKGNATLVHCFSGVGRAGTFAAAYLIAGGESAQAAVARVRACRSPWCVESPAQLAALSAYERARAC